MEFADLPTAAQVALVVLVVVQAGLLVAALVVLARTPAERLTLPRWAWALVVLLGSAVGPIAFLAAGRRPAPVADTSGAGGGSGAGAGGDDAPRRGEATARAVDVLYGDRS